MALVERLRYWLAERLGFASEWLYGECEDDEEPVVTYASYTQGLLSVKVTEENKLLLQMLFPRRWRQDKARVGDILHYDQQEVYAALDEAVASDHLKAAYAQGVVDGERGALSFRSTRRN